MMWKVYYHPEVEMDIRSLGSASAKRILAVIDERLIKGEPDKIGRFLSGGLSGYRRIRVGDTRIIYKVFQKKIEILVIAVGPRKDDIFYKSAYKRTG